MDRTPPRSPSTATTPFDATERRKVDKMIIEDSIVSPDPRQPKKLPETKESIINQLISTSQKNREIRQSKFDPEMIKDIARTLDYDYPLTDGHKSFLLKVGRRYLSAEEKKLLESKQTKVYFYAGAATFVAAGTSVVVQHLFRHVQRFPMFYKGFLSAGIFCASAYFQIEPLLTHYAELSNSIFALHEKKIMEEFEKHRKVIDLHFKKKHLYFLL